MPAATKADPDATSEGCCSTAPFNGEPHSNCCGNSTAPWIPVKDVNPCYTYLTWSIRLLELFGHGLQIFFAVMYLYREVDPDAFPKLEAGRGSEVWIWVPGIVGFGAQLFDSFLILMSGWTNLAMLFFVLASVGGTGTGLLMASMVQFPYNTSLSTIGVYMWLFGVVLTFGFWLLLSMRLVYTSTATHEDFKTFAKKHRVSGRGRGRSQSRQNTLSETQMLESGHSRSNTRSSTR